MNYETALRTNEAYLIACYADPMKAYAMRDEAKAALALILAHEVAEGGK